MRTPTTLLATMAILLPGCSLAPLYERPASPAPAVWEGATADEGSPPAEPTEVLPWQRFFTEERLLAVIELALANNRDLRIAALNVERTRAIYRIERAAQFPNLAAVATGERFRAPSDDDAFTASQYTVGLGVAAWELDFFGRVRNLKEGALERYLATAEARSAAEISLIATVAAGYLALGTTQEHLELAQATLAAQQEVYDLIRQSRELGMAGDLELRQAESQVAAVRAEVARLTGQVAADRHSMELLVGATIPAELLPERLGDALYLANLGPGVSSEVLLSRPDILMAEHQLKAANALIGAARARFFPRIALTAGVGTISSDLSGLFDSGSGTWTFVPEITLPLFTAGAVRAGVEVARLDREVAVAQYEKAIQTAFREVSDALVLRTTLADQIAARRALVAALDEAHRLATARYQAGIDGYLNVLVAQQSLFSARQGLLAVRLAEQVQGITLYAVLGGRLVPGEPSLHR